MTTTENTQRDELASIITDHVHEGLLGYDACTPHAEIAEAADDILAAGYRKPRVVTTVEEAEALAVGTVVLGGDDDVSRLVAFQPVRHVGPAPVAHWQIMGGGMSHTSHAVIPATVLWEPEDEAAA